MLEERFRLIYLSKESSDIKQISLTGKKIKVLASLLGVCIVGIIIGGASVVSHFHNNYRIISLQNDKKYLEQQLFESKELTADIEERLAEVQNMGDMLRKTAGLQAVSNDERKFGVGGPGYYGSLDIGYYSNDLKKTALEMNNDLKKFIRTLQYERGNLNAVNQRMQDQRNRVNHLPSIMPVLGSHVTSFYGNRPNPFNSKATEFHKGLDLAGEIGAKIHASADGKVINIRKSLSYGNVIEIDHGYGIVTKYAHLSRFNVRKGDIVKRWDVIGFIGSTGRSDGPHLHYEVVKNKKRVNPLNYIFN